MNVAALLAIPDLRVAVLLGLLLIAAISGLALRRTARQDRITRRLSELRAGRQTSTAEAGNVSGRILDGISRFGHVVAASGVLSGKALTGIRAQLSAAGWRHSNAVGFFVGAKIILAITLPLLGAAIMPSLLVAGGSKTTLVVVALAVVGLLLPDWLLGWRRKRYHAALERGLPDMLDMLVMCTESGLSLEPALARVGNEIAVIHPVMGAELTLTSNEMHI